MLPSFATCLRSRMVVSLYSYVSLKQLLILFVLLSIMSWLAPLGYAAGEASTASFKVAPSSPVGTDPRGIVVADFNGDGLADLATANNSSNDVSILLGRGGSSGFDPAISFLVGISPSGIAAGDFNGDGKIDLITTNSSSNNVSLLLGDGSGHFRAATNFTVGSDPRSLKLGDFNGDGKLDVAVANYGSDNLSILLGDGSGGFVLGATTAVSRPNSITVGDFNGDGKSDIAVACETKLSVLIGNGTGGFGAAVDYPAGNSPFSVAVADFNGDGKSDLAVANFGSSDISILLGDGNGAFSAPTNFSTGSNPVYVSSGDFNNDGKIDLAIVNRSSSDVSILLGNGTGSFSASTNYVVRTFPRALAVGDFNGDGKLDLAVANGQGATDPSNSVSILYGDGAGKFAAALSFAVGSRPDTVVVSDFNNDGKPDLAVVNTGYVVGQPGASTVSILLGDGASNFTAAPSIRFFNGTRLSSLAAGDFNKDGKIDLVVTVTSSNKIAILLGDGTGRFAIDSISNSYTNPPTVSSYPYGSQPTNIKVGDFNNDGNLDFVVANRDTHNFSIFLGDGAGNFSLVPGFALGSAYSTDDIATADFNGDGNLDLAITRYDETRVAVLLGDGTGHFYSPINLQVGRGPVSIVADDFNRDGKPDIAVKDYSDSVKGYASVFLNSGGGSFGAATDYEVGKYPGSIVAGDFNDDGQVDLAIADSQANTVSILTGDGTGRFGTVVSFGLGSAPYGLAVGDFNSDGNSDLVITQLNNNTVALLLNDFSRPIPSLSVNDVSVTEGNSGTNITAFTVSLSATRGRAITVNFATADGTAAAASDYLSTSGTLSFSPGEKTKTIPVQIIGDRYVEGNETFFVNLSDVTNASIAKGQGTFTIRNDDDPADLAISISVSPNPVSVGSNLTYTITVSNNGASFAERIVVTDNLPPSMSFVSCSSADGGCAGSGNVRTVTFAQLAPGASVSMNIVAKISDSVTDGTIISNIASVTSSPADPNPANNSAMVSVTASVPPVLQFSSGTYTVNENAGTATITVTRSGDLTAAASVNYATSDTAGLTDCNIVNGIASARCDYATTLGTLSFVAGQQSATFVIPIVDDRYAEGAETFSISLSNPTGAAVGPQSSATVTIVDNDTTTSATPIDIIPTFVRQQYLDFFSREPDTTGYQNWLNTLQPCPNGGYGEFNNPSCDRVHISAAFYQSDEFQTRGYFVYRFYQVGLGRRPTYAEFIPDMARVGGSQSPEQEVASKTVYTNDFVQRTEFTTKYNQAQYADPSAYVRELERVAGVTVANEAQLISDLQAGVKTRAQVLRVIAESTEAFNKYFNQGFVAMQYFGYLRRDPDTIGYANWVQTLDTTGDYRHMIYGFLYSTEYRSRFGKP